MGAVHNYVADTACNAALCLLVIASSANTQRHALQLYSLLTTARAADTARTTVEPPVAAAEPVVSPLSFPPPPLSSSRSSPAPRSLSFVLVRSVGCGDDGDGDAAQTRNGCQRPAL